MACSCINNSWPLTVRSVHVLRVTIAWPYQKIPNLRTSSSIPGGDYQRQPLPFALETQLSGVAESRGCGLEGGKSHVPVHETTRGNVPDVGGGIARYYTVVRFRWSFSASQHSAEGPACRGGLLFHLASNPQPKRTCCPVSSRGIAEKLGGERRKLARRGRLF